MNFLHLFTFPCRPTWTSSSFTSRDSDALPFKTSPGIKFRLDDCLAAHDGKGDALAAFSHMLLVEQEGTVFCYEISEAAREDPTIITFEKYKVRKETLI